MLQSTPCKANGADGAVETTTFTGIDKKQIVCDVSVPAVKHFVQLRNLRTYETRIICKGQITSEPRFIKFDSTDQSVTEDEWQAKCTLGNNQSHTFSHVTVTSKQPGAGEQIIRVTLEIDRLRQRGIEEKASLQITVSS